ncbi:sialin-like isoform X2 [Bacillus rossius redtenbacheri]|uniref:sialin-like isoform X2 n=1 Tax=Bacillus rossius redtenbacheri TaxID=93214 RepID=UPI002FDCFC0B
MTAGKTAHKVLLTQQRAAHDLAEAGVSVSAPHDTTEVLKARYVFALLGFLGASILYFVRVNISVAIVAMVNHTALASARSPSEEASHDVCPGGDNDTLLKSEDGEFVWDEERQGLILSGFFYGYAAGQLVGGQLAERFGGKMVYGLGTFLAAALTVVSPQCAWLSHHLLFAVRLLEGLAESVTYPALQFMISKWAPPQERSRFSIIFSGGYLGTITCFPISGLLCDWGVAGGWPMVFYVFGGIGVVWFIPWLFLVYDSPQQHPRISPEERDYIEKSIGAIPSKNAALSTIPYITGGVFSVILGYLMDYIIARGRVTKLTACKICNAITSIGPAVTLVLITLIGCDPVWIIVLLALNGLCMGTQYTGNSMNLIALAPNFAGTTYGLCNTFSSTVGILAPYVTGFLTNGNQTRTQWNVVFYTSAAVSMITFIFYMALCTDEEQPWNNPHPDMALEPMNKKPKSELDKMKSNESFSQLSLHLN